MKLPSFSLGSWRSASPTSDSGLPESKAREVVGILLALACIFLLLALVSYRPDDPSVLQRSTDESTTSNWIGPVGAHSSALIFSFVGLAAFVLPIFLGVSAVRRMRPVQGERVVGRGLGAVIVLMALPALVQKMVGDVLWREATLPAGGWLGVFLSEESGRRLGSVGTMFLLLGAVVVGSTLIVQSSLGELLASWRDSVGRFGERFSLRRSRLREQKGKDKARQRVVQKQLRRAGHGPRTATEEPARVVERRGRGSFSVRRVKGRRVPITVADPAPTQVTRAAATATRTSMPSPAVGPSATPAVVSKKAATTKDQNAISFPAGGPTGTTLPPLNLLSLDEDRTAFDESELVRLGDVITDRCREFGVEGSIEGISPGPVITVFEFQPAPGVKVSQIVNLQNDLALSLKAESIRIDRLAGRSTLGIEVPNVNRRVIKLGALLSEPEFLKSPSPLTLAIGRDLHGRPFFADLATMPHLLVAGATGAGKSVGLQSMITSLLYKASREEVQFIFIDPKRIELGVYSDIPHLKSEVIVEPKKAANALRWAVAEMERRYRLLAEVHVRSIAYYNRAIKDPEVQARLSLGDEPAAGFKGDELSPLPYYVIVIDELADLMMVASSEVETSIARLAQMARAVGIHLIIATQRPSVDVLTGTIKANFPCRISFATASRHDSRTILDQVGSEQLLGKGDMLFMGAGTSRVIRLHGAYISEQETAALVRWLRKQGKPELDPAVLEAPVETRSGGSGGDNDDELFDEAARLVVAERMGSASFLQRRMRIGFSRASRLIDMMEQDGLLGPPQGSKPREVLVPVDYFSEIEEV